MCGRFVLVASAQELIAEYHAAHLVGADIGPSWNIAPTQPIRLVAEAYDDTAAVRELRTGQWGLVPPWPGQRPGGLINARSETVAVKPAFRSAAARRRCLIPADGYYEWMGTSPKTPFYLHDPRGGRLAMAGLFEIGRDATGAPRWTCAVITRAAPDDLGHIHDRSPVVVPPDLRDAWLDCADSTAAEAEALLAAMPAPRLTPREVGRAVGNVRNNSPSLIEPVTAPEGLF